MLRLPGAGRRDPSFPGLGIDTRFVERILLFERVVLLAAYVRIDFGVQHLLQNRDRAGVPWLGAQPTDGFLPYLSIGGL